MHLPILTRALIHTLCLAALTVAPAAALAVEVTNLNDSGSGSFRQAVADTAGGGFVTFQDGLTGIITLSSGEIVLNKSLTISGPGYGVITIKAASTSRIFNVLTGTKLSVNNVTLQGGGGTVGDDGGLIRCLVDLTIDTCVLEDGRASGDGGAVYLSGGEFKCYTSILQNNISTNGNGGAIRLENSTDSFYISQTTFFSNAAYGGGGALSAFNVSSGSFYSCTVHQNEAVTGTGGALSVVSGDLSVNLSSIFSNDATASHGGGIYSSACDLEVSGGSEISLNTAAGAGGGIYSSSGGSIRFEYSTLADNTAAGNYNGAGGGGIAQFGGGAGTWPLIVAGSTVSGNQAATSLAGGVYSEASADISDSTFDENQSAGNGGGLYLAGGNARLYESTISRNVSGAAGGGLYLPNVSGEDAYLYQSTFWHNEAGTNGGGIGTGRTAHLYACTIAENLASGAGDGGGVHATGSLYLYGCILAGNDLDFSGGITARDDCAATGATGSYNLLGVGEGCNGIVNGVNGNIVGSIIAPVFAYLSGLGDYGGPTQTCALYKRSPARDAFLSCTNGGSSTFTTDQRGRPRPRGAACDMGAFELGGGGDGVLFLLINDQS